MSRVAVLLTCTAVVSLALGPPNVVPASSSAAAHGNAVVAGARAAITARLSESSFEASRAGSVTLTYRFARRSSEFGYRLRMKQEGAWSKVASVTRTGSFKGRRTMTVSKLFAGRVVTPGAYRVTLICDHGRTSLGFTVTARSAAITPQAGQWESVGLSGPVSGGGLEVTRLQFTVGSDRESVTAVGFGYAVSWYGCSSGFSAMTSGNAAPVTDGTFPAISPTGPWSGPVSGSLEGTFDSPTSAHGTGTMSGSMWCRGPTGFNELKSGSTGTFSWTAAKQ